MADETVTRKEKLERSEDMTPVHGTVDINVPIEALWEAFRHANWWPRWNKCFFWAGNRDLVLGKQLVWTFEPIRWWYLYKMFAIAKIVEVEAGRKVTWEVTALPGFYARHTYHMESLGEGRSRFGSWEQAMGWSFRLMKRFWLSHFVFVKNRSLDGARQLEHVYRANGKITPDVLEPRRYWLFSLVLILLLAVLLAGARFYRNFVRMTDVELAPGIHALFGGGGNSLLVQSGSGLLLVDTKFPPGSSALRRWVRKNGGSPTAIVNTHYHYDHTEGNPEYRGATIYAHSLVPELMRTRDPALFSPDMAGFQGAGIPTNLVTDTKIVSVDGQEVRLTHPGPAHTHGDLWVQVRKGNVDIIATGDLVFHGFYPFMDLGEGGIDLPGLIAVVRQLAQSYPDAVFVPGHGSIATADDLLRYADYLQELSEGVAEARTKGLTEDQAVRSIDLSEWGLARLPSLHDGLCWATAANNIRWVYRLQEGTADPNDVPCSMWR
jgi:glyoxylase-like metal-dependent hydrolase (beta-lactamase superfamily II)